MRELNRRIVRLERERPTPECDAGDECMRERTSVTFCTEVGPHRTRHPLHFRVEGQFRSLKIRWHRQRAGISAQNPFAGTPGQMATGTTTRQWDFGSASAGAPVVWCILTVTLPHAVVGNTPLFLNTQGRAWTAWAIDCRFKKLKEKLGVKYRAYDFRHTFCTRGLKSGVDAVTMANLVGHTSTVMISKVYGHLLKDPQHLRKALKF